MSQAHYVIFHPDNQRSHIKISAIAIINNQIDKHWSGNVYVDKIDYGNEDPFVFNNPWLYSYCHASQLRRQTRKDSWLQKGSWLFFASGENANKGFLTFDTIFLIGSVHKWFNTPLDLPTKYQGIQRTKKSILWKRHFKFPFQGIHSGVTHTYEADLWDTTKNKYSFLPLGRDNNRVTIPFEELTYPLFQKVHKNVTGKYPVLLTQSETLEILTLVEQKVKTKVLKNISRDIFAAAKNFRGC